MAVCHARLESRDRPGDSAASAGTGAGPRGDHRQAQRQRVPAHGSLRPRSRRLVSNQFDRLEFRWNVRLIEFGRGVGGCASAR